MRKVCTFILLNMQHIHISHDALSYLTRIGAGGSMVPASLLGV